jgi:hypothetical protein
MLWALASSVFVIYLYHKQNAELIPASDNEPASLEAEIVAINARITALESKIARSAGETKP